MLTACEPLDYSVLNHQDLAQTIRLWCDHCALEFHHNLKYYILVYEYMYRVCGTYHLLTSEPYLRGKKLIRKLLIVQLHVYIELYLNKEDLELSF